MAILISPLVAGLVLATALECSGKTNVIGFLWPWAVIGESGIVALGWVTALPSADKWASAIFVSGLYLAAGWILWRSQSRHRGAGWMLLAAALILRGLDGLDRPEWTTETIGLLRISFHGLLGLAMGVSMAVLVLEASRSRAEDLNERLRRLAVISAEAMQAPRAEEVFRRILVEVLESLHASQGLVLMFDDPQRTKFSLRGAVGFSDPEKTSNGRISPGEPWVQAILQSERPTVAYAGTSESSLKRWMQAEKLLAMLLMRIPGKDAPIGLIAIGSSSPRKYESEEDHYVMNVANLLGLTVQNLALVESVSASQRQWEATFDSIDDLILVHDADGCIIRTNRALAARLHAAPNEIVGHAIREVLRQGNAPWNRCPYCESAAGEAEKFDSSFGGYFLATDSALHDSKGKRLGTIHVLRDVTTRRQAENKFRTLFEKVQEGVFISTPDGRFLDFNNAFMRILGYESPEELVAADVSSQFYVDPADRERRHRLLREYGEIADFEFRFRRRDGEIRTAHESSFATRDESGATVAYQGFLLDITELKHAEADVRRRNQELLALNAIADLLGQNPALEEGLRAALLKITELFALDVGAVYFLDEPSSKLVRPVTVGFRAENVHRFAAIDLSAPLLDQLRRVHATVIAGTAPILPEEFRLLRGSESLAALQVVVLWAKDRIMGVLVIGCRDAREFSAAEVNLISAVANQIATAIDKSLLLEKTREAYESLRHTQQQLLQSEKMAAVGQLISGVAHELNNPLTAILGYSQLLKTDGLPPARSSEYLEKLHRQAQRTQHIVQSLLSFARQRKPQRSPVSLHQILEDTLILREYDLRLSKIRVHRDFDPHLPVTSADFNQLQQVFLNILNNAMDAIHETGESGDIWIRTEAASGNLRVEFTDNGPGVQHPHRIFDPFYTTKPVGKGTGLGLSICYGIVKEHGGDIEAHNSPPRGATFVVTLPLLVGGSRPPTDRTAATKAMIPGKILLVDDVETVLQLEEEVLGAAGASVRLARSAQQAIEILLREPVDAIVCDSRLQGQDSAADLYRWIEKTRPEMASRLLFTVSNAGEESESPFLRITGCPALRKPFKIEEFLSAVKSVLSTALPSPART
ncbi:MAG TPA: PAS domain S-box protein [Candidatus Dormibacteraeota bacterium]|nr:PAS domain S-box protein [Candidatus Dormibacteraeota bacterium]